VPAPLRPAMARGRDEGFDRQHAGKRIAGRNQPQNRHPPSQLPEKPTRRRPILAPGPRDHAVKP